MPFEPILFNEYICHHIWFPMSCVCKSWNDIIKDKVNKNKYCPHGYMPQISHLFDYFEILEFHTFKIFSDNDTNTIYYDKLHDTDKLQIYTTLETYREKYKKYIIW